MKSKSECIDFISNLQSINTLLMRFLTDEVSFSELCKAVDFYNANKDCMAFEAIALDLTFEYDDDLKSKIFSSILSEIFRYSAFYETHKDQLSGFYPSDLFNNDIVARINETQILITKSSEIGIQISGMFKTQSDDCDDNIILHKIKERKLHDLLTEHCALTEKLNGKYQRYFEDLKLQDVYDVKIFYLLYYFMVSLELIVHKYAHKDISAEHLAKVKRFELYENNSDETYTDTPVYFDMNIVSQIYNICKNEQFEDISEIDFYISINNPSNIATNFKIRKAEMARVCYLIHLLSEKLIEPLRTVWRETILEKLEISTSYYKSKYRNAVSSDASIKSSTFASDISVIFK